MSKKHYDYKTGKYKGFNTTRGWLLSTEQIASVRYFLILAGIQFKLEAKKNLRNGDPNLTDSENLLPYVYVRM